jgi:hypothetical protein
LFGERPGVTAGSVRIVLACFLWLFAVQNTLASAD